MRVLSGFAVVSGLLLCGCNPVTETREKHIVNTGEEAWLVHGGDLNLPVALSKSDAYTVAAALDGHNQAKLQPIREQGKLFEVIAGTRVKVIGGSNNERHIRILNGPEANRTGWVPFEWLRPATVKAT